MIKFLNNILKERLRKKKQKIVKLRWEKEELKKLLYKLDQKKRGNIYEKE